MLRNVTRHLLELESGLEIALLDWGGDGPLALMHHANGFCGAVLALLAELLSANYRVVALDARGHGHSSKPEGREHYLWQHFRDDLGEVAACLAADAPGGCVALGIGHSFGGTSMLAASARRPGLFERLAIIDPILSGAPYPARHLTEAGTLENPMAAAARRRRHVFGSREEALEQWSGKPLFADWDPRALQLYVDEGLRETASGEVVLQCSGETEALIFESGGSLDAWELAADVLSPTLLVWAMHGNFSREVYAEYVSLLPDARVIDADAGHLVPMEEPTLVAKMILDFAGR